MYDATPEVVLKVNSATLSELVTDVIDAREWVSPPLSVVAPPSEHLLGGRSVWGDPETPPHPLAAVPVLACSCGIPECDALLVSIVRYGDRVTWRDFSWSSRPSVDLSRLGPFRFERAQYEAALARLSP